MGSHLLNSGGIRRRQGTLSRDTDAAALVTDPWSLADCEEGLGALSAARFNQRRAGSFVGFSPGNSSALFDSRCQLGRVPSSGVTASLRGSRWPALGGG